jgi:hypothetical protein
MKGCNPGADFGRKVAIGLKERNIETKVSSKLGSSRTETAGKTTVNNRYHLDEGKVVWGYKDGELTQLLTYLSSLLSIYLVVANHPHPQKQQDDNCRLCKGQAGLIHRLCNVI